MKKLKCLPIVAFLLVMFQFGAAAQPGSGGFAKRAVEGIRNRVRPGGHNQRFRQPRPPEEMSKDEILIAVRNKASEIEQNNPELFINIMQRFDVNQNGVLDDDECLEMHAEHQKRQMQQHGMSPRPQGGEPGRRENMAGRAGAQHLPEKPDHMGLLDGIEIEGFEPPLR